MVKGK